MSKEAARHREHSETYLPGVDSQDLIRAVAFDHVDQLSDHGEVPIAWADLSNFAFEGQRVPLVSQQGIFKPASLDLPISIRTTCTRAQGLGRLERGHSA